MQWVISKLHGDKIIWLIVFSLSLFSILAVYSSTGTLAYRYQSGNTEYYLAKHAGILLFSLFMMYLAHNIDYHYYSRISQLLLYVSFPLLITTLFFGNTVNEARRWLTLPVINLSFQASDLAKMALIMYTARILSKKQPEIKDFKKAFLPVVIPVILICAVIAPANFSTAFLLLFTCTLLMFIGRISMKHLFLMMGSGVAIIGLVILLLFSLPENKLPGRMPTWKARLESFMNDKQDAYQVQQAKIAISKGGIFRIKPGGSIQRNYLPHPYSDFIYAIIIEEYGLLGGAFIIFLYLVLMYRSVKIVAKSPGAFGALLAMGLSLSLVVQAMCNMAVTVNLLPVTGLTLPMVSMGGSSFWFTSIAIGIILSVSRKIEERILENQLFTPAYESIVPEPVLREEVDNMTEEKVEEATLRIETIER